MFAASSLSEESVGRVVGSFGGTVGRQVTIRLDAVLQAVELPAGVPHLGSSLANMNGDTFTLWRNERGTGTVQILNWI